MHGGSGPNDKDWRRAGRCSNGSCVEVAGDGSDVLVRDGKAPELAAHRFSRAEFAAFVAGVKAGEFDDLT